MEGKKILHLDRNSHYGGECASLNLSQLFNKFPSQMNINPVIKREGISSLFSNFTLLSSSLSSNSSCNSNSNSFPTKNSPTNSSIGNNVNSSNNVNNGSSSNNVNNPIYSEAIFGRDRDYNIDLVPKFAMAAGELVDILVMTDVTRYIEFQQVQGSFVWKQGSGICKVPASVMEATTSPLMGWLEKRRAKKFFEFIQEANLNDPELSKLTMIQIYEKFGLEAGTQDFIGHALALHLDESYLASSSLDTIKRIRLYMQSMARFGKSPYVYPMYGLSELPQGFARLGAIYGGTFMLNAPYAGLSLDSNLRVDGIWLESLQDGIKAKRKARCYAVIGDPSYFPDRVRPSGRVIRSICLLDHPVPNTNNSEACQIVIPQRQLNRRYDVYISVLSWTHKICPVGHYVAIASTIIETNDPAGELEFALQLLGPIKAKFDHISVLYEPLESGIKDCIFTSRSYDATSHFETVCEDVKSIYERLMGVPFVAKQRPISSSLNSDENQQGCTENNTCR